MSLFHDTKYFLANSLPPTRQEQLEYALSKNGAIKADSINNATHVITNSAHFQGSETLDPSVFVVSDQWVDRCLVLGKIQGPQYYSVDPGMIFSGIIACAAEQLPTHDLEVLSAGITALGGQWRVALTSDVTHLFAISSDSPKYATAFAHRDSARIKILLPHWFDDSVRLGLKNLSVEPYLWPDPPLLKDIGVTKNHEAPSGSSGEDKVKKALLSTMNTFTPSFDSKIPLPKDVDLMPLKKNVWDGKRILLSWTLSLYGSRREAVEVGIRRAGGIVLRYPSDDDENLSTESKEKMRDRKEARAVDECDILITRWRSGRSYGKAFRLHKTIGTMAWLYHVQSSGQIVRPVDQLLHYPIPRRPIENFVMHEITVTNYTGEAREYIKKLISSMGAKFTPSMTGKNTVLIAAYIQGTKADKARAWSIPVVNHTWLEDCYIQWRHLTMATEKYIVFPPGVDFSSMLGERGVGVRGVELCDEEEEREGQSGSEDENAIEVQNVHNNDEKSVLDNDHDDLDILSMPDPDDLGEFSVPPLRVERGDASATPSRKSPTKLKPYGKLASSSPSKGVISDSVSPAKRFPMKRAVDVIITPARKRDKMKTSPTKSTSKSKSSSPAKRRKIDESREEDNVQRKDITSDFDGDDEGVSRPRVQASEDVPMGVDEEDLAFATPLKKKLASRAKTKLSLDAGSKKTKRMIELEPDLALSDNSNSTLNRTPEMLRRSTKKPVIEAEDEIHEDLPKKSSPRKRLNEDDESYHQSTEATTGTPSTEPTAETTSTTSSALSQAPPKKRLTRRLTNEASFDLEREKEREKERAKNRSATRLTRRATNGRTPSEETIDHETTHKQADSGDDKGEEEKENIDEAHVKSPRKPKSAAAPPPPKTGLLKLTRGDARTRVKIKSAKAKARELYSDSEDEVVNIVEDEPTPVVASVPTKGLKGKGKEKERVGLKRSGKRSRAVSEDEESALVESESEDDADQGNRTTKGASMSLQKRTSRPNLAEVVIDTPMKPGAKNQAKSPAQTYSLKSKGKNKAVTEDAETSTSEAESGDEEIQQENMRSSLRKLKKAASIHVEAEEKAARKAAKVPTSQPKPVPHAGFAPASKQKPKTKPTRRASPSPDTGTHTSTTDIEPVLAKRGAAARAEERLKIMMPDATKFEAELRKARKSGGGMKDIRIESLDQEEDDASAKSRKRKSDLMDVGERTEDGGKKRRKSGGKPPKTEESNEVIEISKGKAKARPSGGSDPVVASDKIYLMTTQVALQDSTCKILEKLGVAMTTRPTQCTHLLAPHLVRTEKFLCALAAAPYILDASWATKSVAAMQLLPEAKFSLRDEDAEVKYDMKLDEALTRAKQLRGTLLIGKIFYVTPRTKVDFKLLRSVVTTHGGQLIQQSPTVRSLKGPANRYVISCPEDISIWRPLASQNIPIFTQEFLLIGVLKQGLDWDNRDLRVPGSAP